MKKKLLIALPACVAALIMLAFLLFFKGGDMLTLPQRIEVDRLLSVNPFFDEETGELVKSALKFSNSKAEDVMISWDNVQKISTALKAPEILEIVKQSVHSRIPVVDRKGNLKGILQIRKFLKAYTKRKNVILASIIDYPYYVDSDEPIDEALTEMSNHRRNLAIVRGTEGEIAGILTVEDILEELVGEIYDEDDRGGNTDE